MSFENHRLDGHLLGGDALRVRRGPDQALLLAGPADEHERGVELEAALGEDARQLHRQHGAAAVVVGAGGVDVVVDAGPLQRIGRSLARCERPCPGRQLPARTEVQRIVVPADVDAARRAAGQHRHHVAQLHRPGDAALLRDLVGVERHLQLRARPLQLVEDPLPRRADPARRGGRVRQRVARAEADERRVERLQAIDRNRGDQRLDARIGRRRRRRVCVWARAAGTAPTAAPTTIARAASLVPIIADRRSRGRSSADRRCRPSRRTGRAPRAGSAGGSP